MYKLIISACLLLTLSACGFKPVHSSGNYSLPVKVGHIDGSTNADSEKLRYVFSKALNDAMNSQNNDTNSYTLDVRLTRNLLSFDTQNNKTTARNRVDLRADFVLLDRNQKEIMRDFVITTDSYEITASPYSSIISEEETTNLLAKSLAQEIVVHLIDAINTEK